MNGSCANFENEFSAHFDGELDSSFAADLDKHLGECQACQLQYAKLGGLSGIMRQAVKNKPMPDIAAGVMDKIGSICQAIAEDLSAYIDNELPPAAQQGVSEHLDSCGDCNAKYKRIKATSQLLNGGLALPEDKEIDLWTPLKSKLNRDCDLIQVELSAFLDQEVAALRHRNVITHLMECASCQNSFAELSQVGDLIRNNYKPDIADDFDLWPDIKAKLQVVPFVARPKPQAKAVPLSRKLFALVAAIMIIAITATMLNKQPTYSYMTAEDYMIDSFLSQPDNSSDSVVYEN